MTPADLNRLAKAIDPAAFAIPEARQAYYRRRQAKAIETARRVRDEIALMLREAAA